MTKDITMFDGLGFDENGILITAAQFEETAKGKKARLFEEQKALEDKLRNIGLRVDQLHRMRTEERLQRSPQDLKNITIMYREKKKEYATTLRNLNALRKVLLRYLYDEKR